MSVVSHGLERVVLEMLNHGNIVLDALWSRVLGAIVRAEDLGLVLFPVGPINDIDIVVHEPLPVLIVVKVLEVFRVRRGAGAKEGSHRHIVIIPLRNDAHSSEHLGRALRVTYHSHLTASIPLLNRLYACWEIVGAILLPIQGPELRLVDTVEDVLLGVLYSRVVWQVDIETHLGDLESQRHITVAH